MTREEKRVYHRSWKKTKAGRAAQRRYNHSKAGIAARKRWAKNHRVEVLETAKIYRDALRDQVLRILGNRCSDPECRWMNDDGSFGCCQRELLQIDHKQGGGVKEYAALGSQVVYRKIIALGQEARRIYQLLCANCNWRKKYVNQEIPHRNR